MSSYAKALEGVMRLFPKKIKVTFVDADSGGQIGQSKIPLDQLPEKFNKPTLIKAMGKAWRVVDASPRKAIDFEFTKSLVLRVRSTRLYEAENNRFYIPTIANEKPGTSEISLFDQFALEMLEENWRQIEFLPVSVLEQVKEDVSEINLILHPEKKYDRLLGYERRYVRDNIIPHNHDISFDKFCELVNIMERGAVRIPGGFVKNGFALRSFNYEYYGVIEEGMIKSIGVKEFDSVDEELMNVLSAFGLVMVVWCEGRIISAEVKEGGEEEIDLAGSGQVLDAVMT